MKKSSFNVVMLAVMAGLLVSIPAVAHEPVPGPDFAGCRRFTCQLPGCAVDPPYAPLPEWDIDIAGDPAVFPPPGSYDFCAYADTVYCGLAVPLLLNVLPEIRDYANLLQCMYMDINGPLDLEGDADIPVTGNGMPDAQYELGILAYVLNDTTHPLHIDATIAFQDNFNVIKDLVVAALREATLKSDPELGGDKDLVPILTAFTPYLASSLSILLAGFATMDDELTNFALDEVLGLLDDLGLEPPEGGIGAISTGIEALGPYGDVDGDGASNYAEYRYFVEELGYSVEQFIDAVFDPNQTPPTPEPAISVSSRTGFNRIGDTVELNLSIINYYELPEYIRWYKDGMLLEGEDQDTLTIVNAQVEDSGYYMVAVGVLVEADEDKDLVEVELTAGQIITVGDFALPVAGAMGVAVLVGLCAMIGVSRSRKRK